MIYNSMVQELERRGHSAPSNGVQKVLHFLFEDDPVLAKAIMDGRQQHAKDLILQQIPLIQKKVQGLNSPAVPQLQQALTELRQVVRTANTWTISKLVTQIMNMWIKANNSSPSRIGQIFPQEVTSLYDNPNNPSNKGFFDFS